MHNLFYSIVILVPNQLHLSRGFKGFFNEVSRICSSILRVTRRVLSTRVSTLGTGRITRLGDPRLQLTLLTHNPTQELGLGASCSPYNLITRVIL